MGVGINDILHVLAHELRTPVGIAHGYVRLLLDDRLPTEADRKRALEQMQKALGRLSDLSHETTALASWYEEARDYRHPLAVRALLEAVAEASYDWPVMIETPPLPEECVVDGADASALIGAVIAIVRATARELRGTACDVTSRVVAGDLEMLIGPEELQPGLAGGPDAPGAGPVALERGGLGLTLIHAAVVLDAHRVQRWTMNGSRQTVGLRLPLGERRQS